MAASFYIVLLCVVGPLYAAAPFSWAFVTVSVCTGRLWTYTLPMKAAFLWATIEAIFSIYYTYLVDRTANTPPVSPEDVNIHNAAFSRVLKSGMADLTTQNSITNNFTLEDEELDSKERGSAQRLGSPVESVVELAFDDPRARDFRESLRVWFHKQPWSSIHAHEMRQWLYWAIFNEDMPQEETGIPPAQRVALDNILDLLQKRAGATVKQGSNLTCQSIRPSLDRFAVLNRPLAYYLLIWAANYLTFICFQMYYGLHYRKSGNFEYLVRVPESVNKPTSRPLVIFHGLGLGLFQYYTPLANLLSTLPSRPILIPLQPHISQNIFHPHFLNPLSRQESVRCLFDVIGRLGWKKNGVDMLSHSNGTFFHTWALKSQPDLIKRSCFIDPVALCSWEGDVCYNFLYQKCTTGLHLIMRYFVGTELGVVNIMQRHFDWRASTLWFEDIPNATDPRKAAYFLSGKDVIVNAGRVKRYLRAHGVREGLWFDSDARHGQALIPGSRGFQNVMTWLKDEGRRSKYSSH